MLPYSEAGAFPIPTAAVDEQGFELTYPYYHGATNSRFGPDGTTRNGWKKDLTHKDTGSHVGPRGKTWSEEEKELFIAAFMAEHPVDHPPTIHGWKNFWAQLKQINELQTITFVGLE